MAKPRLEKVRALFYVLQHIQEGASNFDTPSCFSLFASRAAPCFRLRPRRFSVALGEAEKTRAQPFCTRFELLLVDCNAYENRASH